MSNPFFDHPILNSPYDYPRRHWELDELGQPTQKIIDQRRSAKFVTPIPKPKKHKASAQKEIFIPGFPRNPNTQRLNKVQLLCLLHTWTEIPSSDLKER
jgi:hypothetical protein